MVSARGVRGYRRLSIGGVMLLSAVAYCSLTPSAAATDWPSSEVKIKAVCIYNYTQFVEWPAGSFTDTSAPYVIGILGSDPFGTAFDEAMAGRTVNGRPISIKRFSDPKAAVGCHILYISMSESSRMTEIMAALKGKSILTVAETAGFIQSGGIVRIYLGGDYRVHFEIKSETAKEVKLKISSELLNLARPQQ